VGHEVQTVGEREVQVRQDGLHELQVVPFRKFPG
jgi:hypothetical protein